MGSGASLASEGLDPRLDRFAEALAARGVTSTAALLALDDDELREVGFQEPDLVALRAEGAAAAQAASTGGLQKRTDGPSRTPLPSMALQAPHSGSDVLDDPASSDALRDALSLGALQQPVSAAAGLKKRLAGEGPSRTPQPSMAFEAPHSGSNVVGDVGSDLFAALAAQNESPTGSLRRRMEAEDGPSRTPAPSMMPGQAVAPANMAVGGVGQGDALALSLALAAAESQGLSDAESDGEDPADDPWCGLDADAQWARVQGEEGALVSLEASEEEGAADLEALAAAAPGDQGWLVRLADVALGGAALDPVLRRATALDVSNCRLTELALPRPSWLRSLVAGGNELQALDLGAGRRLQHLDLSFTPSALFEASDNLFRSLRNVRSLVIDSCGLRVLPAMDALQSLEKLSAAENELEGLPTLLDGLSVLAFGVLGEVDLRENPVCEESGYAAAVTETIGASLKVLDNRILNTSTTVGSLDQLDGLADAIARTGLADAAEGAETCSCLEGNPCADKYGCKDWENREAVAKAVRDEHVHPHLQQEGY